MGNIPIGELPASLQALVTARAEGLAQGREEGRKEVERAAWALGEAMVERDALIEERDKALAVLEAKPGETLTQAVQRTAVELHEARVSDLRKAEDEAFLTRLFHVLTLEPLRESDLTVFETRAETDPQRATVRQLSVVLVRAREEGGSEEIRELKAQLKGTQDGEIEEAKRADDAEAELEQVREELAIVKAERDSALSQLRRWFR